MDLWAQRQAVRCEDPTMTLELSGPAVVRKREATSLAPRGVRVSMAACEDGPYDSLARPPLFSTTSTFDDLQHSLGGTYKLDRELGGGGMSRVFLADDPALGRKVVLKVLPVDLAAVVNVERFNREALLLARLQHPHIVPLLTVGSLHGLPRFSMPYIEGESLRARSCPLIPSRRWAWRSARPSTCRRSR